MKYERLTKEQFEIFHEKFAEFLATQKIDNKEWKKIVETNPKMTEEQLNLFSDIVWDDVLTNAKYLEHTSKKHLKAFLFMDKTVKMISVEIDENLDIDFLKNDGIKKLFEQIMDKQIKLYQGEKKLGDDRKKEMFQLILEGCTISDGKIFKALDSVINS